MLRKTNQRFRKTGTNNLRKKKKKQEAEKENMATEDIICKIKWEIIKNKKLIMTGICCNFTFLYVKVWCGDLKFDELGVRTC